VELYKEAGFTEIKVTHEFTHEPVKEDDWLFCVLGKK
jgi:hypothetical protein